MGLITETNAQYYAGQQIFPALTSAVSANFTCTFNEDVVSAFNILGTQISAASNYTIYIDDVAQPENLSYISDPLTNTITLRGVNTFSLTPVIAGTGYVIGDIMPLAGGTGTNATVEITSTTGEATIVNPGSGYVNGETVNTVSPSGGTDATYSYDITQVLYSGTVYVQLKQSARNNNNGSYEYISLNDIINNFIVAYIGVGKLIPSVKRTDLMFHAKRGLQEFSYDTLRSIKSQELTIPPSLSLTLPQDYVNYVKLSWVDKAGVKHIIYPTTLTSNPTELPIQDNSGEITQNKFGGNNEATQSQINQRWSSNNPSDTTGQITDAVFQNADVYGLSFDKIAYGQRYGLEPEVSQKNGWFTINERTGSFNFSSGLNGRLIILEYISDGLAYDEDTRIPKMAEQAMYMHIAYSILSGRINIPEYIVNRFKKDRSSALRNAKIRLSNIKLEEFTQVMRGKSKWIKH